MNSFSIRNGAPSLSCPPRLPALRTRRRRTGRSSAARTRSCRWRRCRQPATARSSRPAGPTAAAAGASGRRRRPMPAGGRASRTARCSASWRWVLPARPTGSRRRRVRPYVRTAFRRRVRRRHRRQACVPRARRRGERVHRRRLAMGRRAQHRNRALAGDTGDFSPHWSGATFSSFVWESLDAAGRHVTFSAFVNTASGSRVGLWRAGSSAGP